MGDPLSLIRQSIISGTQIRSVDGYYSFGDQKVHESAPTAFKRTLKSDVYHYTVRDIMFFLENSSESVAEYRRKAVEARIIAVVEQDKQALQSFITGSIESCPQIDWSLISSIAPKETSHQTSSSDASKSLPKRKIEDTVDLNSDKLNLERDRAVLAKLRADDYTPFSRLTVLSTSKVEFSNALKLFHDKILKPKDPETSNILSTANNKSSAPVTPGITQKMPIIIVPSALTSNITLLNAKAFLENGIFTQFDPHATQKPKMETVNRSNSTFSSLHYKIIDDPTKLLNEEWDRVVAAFVTGQQWQFRGWKYSNPVDLFQHVLGAHLMFDDRAPDATVQSWNCKILKVNQYKQHVNAGAAKEFWMYVDDFIRLHKPQYANNIP